MLSARYGVRDFIAVVFLGLFLLLAPPTAHAQDKAELESLKQEIEDLKAQIAQGGTQDEQIIEALLNLVQRIETLESQTVDLTERVDDSSGGQISDEELEELRERLEELEVDAADNFESIFNEFARRVALSGYTTFAFLVPEPGRDYPETDRPWFHSFGLNLLLNSQITAELRFFAELVQEEVSRFGQGQTGSSITIQRSFMEFLFNDYIGFRFGIILVPFGWLNRNPEDWRYAFDTRPIVNEIVFPSVYNDVGAELFGFIYRGDDVQFEYNFAIINGLNDGIGVTADTGSGGFLEELPQFAGQGGDPNKQPGLRGARPGENVDNNVNKALVLRLGANVLDIVAFGVSGYAGRYDSDDAPERSGYDTVKPEDDYWMGMVGADIRVNYEGFLMRGEFTHVFIEEFPDNFVVDFDGDPNTLGDQRGFRLPEFITGFSLDLEYHFWFEGLKDTFLDIKNPFFFVAVRFDYAATAIKQILLGNDEIEELAEIMLSVALGYRPYHRAAIRLEFIQGGLDWMGVDGYSSLVLKDNFLFAFSVSLGF